MVAEPGVRAETGALVAPPEQAPMPVRTLGKFTLLDDVRGRRSTRTEVRPRAGRRVWRRRTAR